ncbi:MAG: DUF503 domain-containing protein [Anaerolineae bacterium]
MIIGACRVRLYLPGVASLKEKRGVLKPLLHKLRQQFEVAVAEIDHQDVWQSSDIAVVSVATDAGHVYAVLEKTVHWIEDNYYQVQVIDWDLELR